MLESRGRLHWLFYALSVSLGTLMSPSWQLRANSTSSIWIHFKPSPSKLQEGEKPENCSPNGTIWRQSLAAGRWRPQRLWGVVEGKADSENERQSEMERQWSGCVYQTMSWVLSASRAVITGRRRRNPDWGKKAEMLRLLGCRPWALNITAMLTSPSYTRGHESRVPDQCSDTWSQGGGGGGHRQRRRIQVGQRRPASTWQEPHWGVRSVTQAP